MKVTVGSGDIPKLDRDISGTYQLLEKCGTANGALHKKIDTEITKLPALFMLFDPHRTNDAEDCFVFSINTRRLEYQECRPIVCKLDPSWRQSATEGEETVACHMPFRWAAVDTIELIVCGYSSLFYYLSINSAV